MVQQSWVDETGGNSLSEQQIRENLGTFLRSIRKKRGYKSSEVARALNKSVQYVCDIEMGRRGGSHLAPESIVAWANYLNIPISSITKRQNIDSRLDMLDEKARSYFRIVRNKARAAKLREGMSELSRIVAGMRDGSIDTGVGIDGLEKTIVKIAQSLEYSR